MPSSINSDLQVTLGKVFDSNTVPDAPQPCTFSDTPVVIIGSVKIQMNFVIAAIVYRYTKLEVHRGIY
ncbi:hypothetical protein BSZ28_09145 [Pseudomonas moraviensis]|uniref:Uncharacterized protein n=1 Tax=Pseudomonas moraviensis R28-S TaxID=1395516 RepID=V8R2X1_9PSED|nr:hypothetical protein PMO01_21275 [Pseudomonas moraviensis R28-S]OJT51397.1 hypothetical protein BSZ28_09145 [Pseudomonas moraviensis]PYB93986.1 hypothetical protein DMX04_27335 [Pseudomonas koreensis]